MKNYLVIWRSDEDQFNQSEVKLGAVVDARQMTNAEWVIDAAVSEGYSRESAEELVGSSYELILVCDMPSVFYV